MVAVERARRLVLDVLDPELPLVTLGDLGIVRGVAVGGDGTVRVSVTPTYTGCPALAQICADIRSALAREGFGDCEIDTVLSPAWTTDWITEDGRRKLREHGIAPPGAAPRGPVPLQLSTRPPVQCPRCGGRDTAELSRFSAMACTSLHTCRSCQEPFDQLKAI